jgi:hypothetical protein
MIGCQSVSEWYSVDMGVFLLMSVTSPMNSTHQIEQKMSLHPWSYICITDRRCTLM